MTIQADTMGEQPIFTCKAHVFHIDPKTKRWAKLKKSVIRYQGYHITVLYYEI
jgi:hypothetical protein